MPRRNAAQKAATTRRREEMAAAAASVSSPQDGQGATQRSGQDSSSKESSGVSPASAGEGLWGTALKSSPQDSQGATQQSGQHSPSSESSRVSPAWSSVEEWRSAVSDTTSLSAGEATSDSTTSSDVASTSSISKVSPKPIYILDNYDDMKEYKQLSPRWVNRFHHNAGHIVYYMLDRGETGPSSSRFGAKQHKVKNTSVAIRSTERAYWYCRISWNDYGDKADVLATAPPHLVAKRLAESKSPEFAGDQEAWSRFELPETEGGRDGLWELVKARFQSGESKSLQLQEELLATGDRELVFVTDAQEWARWGVSLWRKHGDRISPEEMEKGICMGKL